MSHHLSTMSAYTDYTHHLLSPTPSPMDFSNLHPLSGITISPSFHSGFQLSPGLLTPRGKNRPRSVPPPAPELSPLKTPRLDFPSSSSPYEERQQPVHPQFMMPHFSAYGRHLPHFHPPKYSRRLRNLVSKRRKPLRISLLPVHGDGRQRWAKVNIEADEEYEGSSAGSFGLAERWRWVVEPRVLLAVIVAVVVLGILVTALGIKSILGG